MAITRMTRFTLLTFRGRRRGLLGDLQKFGDVHFRDLSADEAAQSGALLPDYSQEDISRCESELDKVGFALGKLSPHVPKAGMTAKRPTLSFAEFDGYLESYDYKGVCAYIKERDDKIASTRSEIARLKAESEGLKAWMRLDVSPAALDGLAEAKYLAGTVNKTQADAFKESVESRFPCAYVEFLGASKDDMALLLLIDGASYDGFFSEAKDLGFSKATLGFSDTPARIVAENAKKATELEKDEIKAREQIAAKAGEHQKLLIVKDCIRTALEREKAAQNFLGSDSVTFIEGWIPEENKDAFRSAIRSSCGEDYFLEETEVERDSDDVPIKLKNNKIISAFENVTSMYSMPKYNEFDPTPLLFPFYWLFFGLMVGDIGYGLVLMAGCFFALKALDLKEGMKKFIKFFFILSFGVVLGGCIYGSFFGFAVITPLPILDANGVQTVDENGNLMFKALLDSQLDIPVMLIFSIALGIVHVLFGVALKGVKCIKNGDIAGAVFDSVFWIIAVVSGIGMILSMMAPGMIPPVLFPVFKWVFYGSLIVLAATQGRSSPSIGGKIGNGIYGVYGISGYLGDLVSYTRIVALALSGAYIAFSFNRMAEILPEGFARIVFGFIIMLLGQTLNFGLGLLGAYVHTCRLQYVEYFGKFYDGGGVPFSPLKIQSESVHINN